MMASLRFLSSSPFRTMSSTSTLFCRGGPSSSRLMIAPSSISNQNMRIYKYEMAAPSSVSNQYFYETFRFMGGGPRNPEHKGRGRPRRRQRRKSIKKKGKVLEEAKKKDPTVRVDPQVIAPVTEEIRPYLPAIERYVLDDWFVKFPKGARTNRLRSDLAYRMKEGGPSKKKKLDPSIVESIAAELARKNLAQLWKNSRGYMVIAPVGITTDFIANG